MKILSIILFFIFIDTTAVFSQYYSNQNKIWAFGSHAGLDFTSGTPAPLTTSVSTPEGTASVSDSAGHLLFYTDGTTVYNRLGSVMPSGSSIVSFETSSTTQAAVIMPVIGIPSKYYLFSLEDWLGSGDYCHLAYSIVDMTLDSGRGDVVTSSMGTPVTNQLSEKMIAIAGDCKLWLVTHKKDSAVFLAYKISASGFSDSPVISRVGTRTGLDFYIGGVLKSSPDGTKIVSQSAPYPSLTTGATELFDFDAVTGIVSNYKLLDSTHCQYGAEFSPDNTKLYANYLTDSSYGAICQYDVSLTTAAAIRASKVDVFVSVSTGIAVTDLKLAPDNKIYSHPLGYGYFTNTLDCITAANSPGALCHFVPLALSTAPDTSKFGFPNTYLAITATVSATFVSHDSAVCIASGDSITIFATDTGAAYLWYDGTTANSHFVNSYGNYWVLTDDGCSLYVDTIKVTATYDTLQMNQDTSVCSAGDGTVITLTAPPGSNYVWFDGDTSAVDSFNSSGNFWVEFSNGCLISFDTFHVTLNLIPGPITGPDSLCQGDTTGYLGGITGGIWKSNNTAIAMIDSVSGLTAGLTAGNSVITYILPTGCLTTKSITVTFPPCTAGLKNTIRNPAPVDYYPNPATDELTLKMNSGKFRSVCISNSIGQVFIQQQLYADIVNVDVHLLPPGVYYLSFCGENGFVVRRFVKE